MAQGAGEAPWPRLWTVRSGRVVGAARRPVPRPARGSAGAAPTRGPDSGASSRVWLAERRRGPPRAGTFFVRAPADVCHAHAREPGDAVRQDHEHRLRGAARRSVGHDRPRRTRGVPHRVDGVDRVGRGPRVPCVSSPFSRSRASAAASLRLGRGPRVRPGDHRGHDDVSRPGLCAARSARRVSSSESAVRFATTRMRCTKRHRTVTVSAATALGNDASEQQVLEPDHGRLRQLGHPAHREQHARHEDSRSVVTWRIVSVWPTSPRMTSWSATRPGQPHRVDRHVAPSISSAVRAAVPEGASSLPRGGTR